MNRLAQLSDANLYRVYQRLWDRMTHGDGYQPFGYDRPTLLLVHPTYMRELDSIRSEAVRRRDAGTWTLGA